jgi:methionyl-tRNA synthetase
MAAGVELPQGIVSHGFWLSDGRKMSKTLGNVIEPGVMSRHMGVDAVRYFLLREMSFGQDCSATYESIINRANSDLASGLGNLVSRTVTMVRRYCDGRVPAGEVDEAQRLAAKRAGVDPEAESLSTVIELARDQFVSGFEDFAFHRALETAWGVIARVDKLISDAKPWELAKDETQRQVLNAVLYRAAEALRWLAVMLYPVMPRSAEGIWSQLGQGEDITRIDPSRLAWGGLKEGTAVGEVSPLFPRLDKKKIMDTIEEEKKAQAAAEGAHATQAAVPGSPTASDTRPDPPVVGATEADAVPSKASDERPRASHKSASTTSLKSSCASGRCSRPTACLRPTSCCA